MSNENNVLLHVEDLFMHFPIYRGVVRRQVGAVHAVDGVTFYIKRGDRLGGRRVGLRKIHYRTHDPATL